VRNCSCHEASTQLLCSALSKPRSLCTPHTPCLPDPSPSLHPSFGCSLIALHPFCAVGPRLHPVQEMRPHSTEQRGQPLPSPSGSAGPGAPQCVVGPPGVRAHCWLLYNLLSARAPIPFSGAAAQHFMPSLYVQPGLLLSPGAELGASPIKLHVAGDCPALQFA